MQTTLGSSEGTGPRDGDSVIWIPPIYGLSVARRKFDRAKAALTRFSRACVQHILRVLYTNNFASISHDTTGAPVRWDCLVRCAATARDSASVASRNAHVKRGSGWPSVSMTPIHVWIDVAEAVDDPDPRLDRAGRGSRRMRSTSVPTSPSRSIAAIHVGIDLAESVDPCDPRLHRDP
jgi:hypothetical protein